jgi:hypothetical protein
MHKSAIIVFIFLIAGISSPLRGQMSISNNGETMFRAPAYPLITIDPYTSAWSFADQLFDGTVNHWTGRTHGLIGAIRVDGEVFRFMGQENVPWKTIAAMGAHEPWPAQYTTQTPPDGWQQYAFDDTSWEPGKGAFGTRGVRGLSTQWRSKEIWIRRIFEVPAGLTNEDTYLIFSHDDNIEIYLNGKELVNTGFKTGNNVLLKIDANLLLPGKKNVLAAYCQNPGGAGLVDFGIFQKKEKFMQTAVQERVALSATRTIYEYSCGPVNLRLEFVSPLLTDNLDILSRPVNYINYEVTTKGNRKHEVQLYFEITPEWAVHETNQEVVVNRGNTGDIDYLRAGTTEQPVLQKKGDNVRIDWGYVYLAANQDGSSKLAIGDYFGSKETFLQTGKLPVDMGQTISQLNNQMPAMAYVRNLNISSQQAEKGYVMIAYDDLKSIQYFGDNLKAWWTQDGKLTIHDMLQAAAAEHDTVMKRCYAFDKMMWDETFLAGGKNYADLCVLAYRQSIAAHKLVKDTRGNLLFLSKENFSNGSIGTVDISYPSSPLFLRYNPDLLKGMLTPIFYYSESGKWTKPFAAHDVGTYPIANGQTYGGDMPIEESGNMLIMTTAIAHMEGNAEFAAKHWEVLTTWANYLLEHGLDPENQLCTDDFAGHLAHNVNLSVKAIMAIAGYGRLADMLGKKDIAEKYTTEAKRMAREWMKMADDGGHYRLTFDQPGTWSQKYNLAWDKILNLNVFPDEVAHKEIAYYLNRQNKYGLPLDNRRDYTKSDWIVWSAALSDNLETFQKFIDPLHLYVTETPNRVPMSDWYGTHDAIKLNFQARSVVGAYFIKLLK